MGNTERIINEAKFIVLNKSTLRQTAMAFGISKSTVHKDLTERLYKINFSLYSQVRKLLDLNLTERHLRGGKATKLKYQKQNFLKELKTRILNFNPNS